MGDETKEKTPGDRSIDLIASYGAKARVAAKEAKDTKALLDTANARIAELEKAAGKPSEKDARIAELEGQLRAGKHLDAWRKAAKGKVDPDAIDDLYTLSGYKAEGEPDDTRVAAAIDAALKTRPKLAATAGDQTTTTSTTTASSDLDTTRTPPAGDRGSHHNGGSAIVLTRADLANPKKMLDPAFAKAAAKAVAEGRLTINR